jgi:hypothetical protein
MFLLRLIFDVESELDDDLEPELELPEEDDDDDDDDEDEDLPDDERLLPIDDEEASLSSASTTGLWNQFNASAISFARFSASVIGFSRRVRLCRFSSCAFELVSAFGFSCRGRFLDSEESELLLSSSLFGLAFSVVECDGTAEFVFLDPT